MRRRTARRGRCARRAGRTCETAAAARVVSRTSRLSCRAGHEDDLTARHLALVLSQALDRRVQRQPRANLRLQIAPQKFLNPARDEKFPERVLAAQPVGEPEAADALALEDERARVNDAALERERAVN